MARRSNRKKFIDLRIDNVEATVVSDGQSRVLVKLLHGLTLWHGEDDRCSYRRGVQVSCPDNGPGNPATHFLGMYYSMQPGIIDLQFRKHNGAFVHIDLDDPDHVENLRNLANLMLDRAEAFAELIHSTNP